MTWEGAWPPHEVRLSRSRLVELVALVRAFDGSDASDAHAALARFLAIRSCGHIEFTFDECISQFANAKSHPMIAAHVRGGLFRGTNPRPQSLIDRTRKLSSEWANELESYLHDGDKLVWRELSFLVDRRNSISHGQNEGLGVRKSLDLANIALDVGDWITSMINPTQ
jgi:hypothetical protein